VVASETKKRPFFGQTACHLTSYLKSNIGSPSDLQNHFNLSLTSKHFVHTVSQLSCFFVKFKHFINVFNFFCMKNLLFALFFAAFCLPMFANNITISNQTLTNGSAADGYGYVTFDLSWENSWRVSSAPSNWDAAWVFVKYRVGSGEWLPANLHNTGHTAGTGTAADITVGLVDDNAAFNASTNPGIGAFVYRSSDGTGTFTSTGLKLRWDYGADGIAGGTNVEVKVFAIEMVRVLEGAFNVGGGGGVGNSHFTSTTISTVNATTAPSGTGSLGGEAGGYPTGQTAPANASWPNGYGAFYCMKYEGTQQQYVDFLNTLTQTQADARKANESTYRYAITGTTVGIYATTNPNVACNFISWADDAAYADWSGLRPMTELEFEKACHGPLAAVVGEYAWGTADIAGSAYTLSNAGASNEGIATNYSTTAGNAMYSTTKGTIGGPVRVGIFSNGTSGRVSAGASYWGIMELSGNVYERPVTIANEKGRAFTGTHGDGVLASSGDANAATWPGTDADGAGLRGGSWGDGIGNLKVSDRVLAGTSYSIRNLGSGFRAVRR
jgi:formylglycine-generating enzyme required for sulfatase activity